MIRVPRQLRRRWHEIVTSRLPRHVTPSDKPLAIVMPLAAKDARLALRSIPAIKAHVRHPITDFIVVGQDNADLRELTGTLGATFIPEQTILAPFLDHPLLNIGWLKQQFIKLSIFDFIDQDTVLVHDSDTVPVRDIAYFNGEKPIFYLSDEYTHKFFEFPRLLWPAMKRYPRSFVAHSMVFQRDVMARINANVLSRHSTDLRGFILNHVTRDNFHALSEFEIYGNFMHQFEPDAFSTSYWYNVKAKLADGERLDEFMARRRRFNSISLHTRQP
jgi:hypothetical protein